MRHRSRLSVMLMGLLSVAAIGCENKPPPAVDLVQTGVLKAQGGADETVVVSEPRLIEYDIAMEIKGSVTRQPGVDEPVTGRLELDVISPGGAVLYTLPLSWNPYELPVTGSRASSYFLRYGEIPPAGSTIRVVHVNAPVAAP